MKNIKGHRTTVYMRKDISTALEKYVETSGCSKQLIITRALSTVLPKLRKGHFSSRSVKYQERGADWERVHYTYTASTYDQFMDIRKVYRLTFSFLVAIALVYYFSLDKNEQKVDSYPLKTYKKTFAEREGQIIYTFTWGERTKQPQQSLTKT